MIPRHHRLSFLAVAAAGVLLLVPVATAQQAGLQSRDLYELKSVGAVRISPDGSRIAYSVQANDRPGSPYSQVWIMDVAGGSSRRLVGDRETASGPVWSPDGQWLAYRGARDGRFGLVVARPDGSEASLVAPIGGTNHPLPSAGESVAWSPDGRQIAFVSATPGPEVDAGGDPMVITRYLYKPTASEGLTRFNDNRRLHIFVADLASRQVRQLTSGDYYEHSINWSPRGDEILFVSNREPHPDRVFNYDIFAVSVADGEVRRLTDTKSAEYDPVWSPDAKAVAFLATTRLLTSSETTMEDTHVWVMGADGSNRREVGGGIDNRQQAPKWAPDGRSLYVAVQERGSVRLYRLPVSGGVPEAVVPVRGVPGAIGAWSLAKHGDGLLAYALATPFSPPELYLRRGSAPPTAVTRLNGPLLGNRVLAEVDSFTFPSFDGGEIEAFLTRPINLAPSSRHPLMVMIHGGPHAQQGPVFNFKAQVYAGLGWGVLMVNYRGSTGYGQRLADAIFGDQNGGEAKDVLAGLDAALARYSWIDPERLGVEGGSYGGQLTNWLVTQTDRFKAAISIAGIANLVSFNYMAYYHDYLAVEFGRFPHEGGLMDRLWERSPLRYVARVRTPTLLVHGENDNDVPVAEAEQFYIALKDVGVETVMVRYPREGHGVREPAHVADLIDRSVAWYRQHFPASQPSEARR